MSFEKVKHYFEKEGLVALGRGTITIKNVSGLKKLLT